MPLRLRWFWNDGGPLLILPHAAERAWEGSDEPSSGRVVEASYRWNEADATATDYDRACELVEKESAVSMRVGQGNGVLLGTVAAQSAAWLPGASPDEFFAVGVECADDVSPNRLKWLLSEMATDWRPLPNEIDVDTHGLLMLHAADRPSEITEYSAILEEPNDTEGIGIGDGLRYLAPKGRYAVDTTDVKTTDGDYLTFVRFGRWRAPPRAS